MGVLSCAFRNGWALCAECKGERTVFKKDNPAGSALPRFKIEICYWQLEREFEFT
jgi:hypothetical protein